MNKSVFTKKVIKKFLTYILIFNKLDCANDPMICGLIHHYSFEGNANDEISEDYNGSVSDILLAPDRRGHPNSAYRFTGKSYIALPASSLNGLLDFTLCFWISENSELPASTLMGGARSDVDNAFILFRDDKFSMYLEAQRYELGNNYP